MPYKTALLDHLEKPDALPTADNAVLVLNALDSLSGSDALISLRPRGHYSRTFTVVEHARQQARARLRDMSAELKGRLDMTEKRLAELATGPYSFVCIVGIILLSVWLYLMRASDWCGGCDSHAELNFCVFSTSVFLRCRLFNAGSWACPFISSAAYVSE
ncbi:hypothetical protein GIV23_21840 [Pseudomonas sp. PA-1-2A]|uniref:hypothetical protein n=1 Tax=Pseudomonas TaxID=286 RepID=UPI001EEFEA24|nr:MULTISPECIES: hypothetical protein [Pseudomonas]MCF5692541.1 hypothetical protein [Pseudomonas sp. PA-1-8C]MCF5786079.1 hypothetical protein [Pseudomonas sp. PA-1-6G]MCF5791748.1 hypothetical protein [Pseudomonas sp. PA-1-6B]MCF5797463.1 hypothetical protein [Pseudomonas sp. PA-1-5A]MCF5815958.1 hypothetical protein [Pseudomonas sp. PA-1-2A]